MRTAADADITVRQRHRAAAGRGQGPLPLDRLSARQRETFDLARERGYYAWPRKVSPETLATELGITTSTFHEHLRKAEEKLFDRS
ncbi:helix-turn-helix domain-containing protein [Halorubrum sp. CSM-61]|uniref:helix-turn-helix domain-containing protein n=1 Tax=Halorubrum sp. CSM-61 TaxID=2485838 RepID=UPI000F4BE768